MCGRVFDTKRHSNIKAKAAYRRIDKYTKSLPRSKEERARREMVLKLWLSGYAVSRIAQEVGVSVRTVNRDLEKLKPTIKRRYERYMRGVAEEQRLKATKQLEGLSPVEQAQWISRYLAEKENLKIRRRPCHKLLVKIDADAATRGEDALSYKPRFPLVVQPYVINFKLVLNGESQFIGQLKVE